MPEGVVLAAKPSDKVKRGQPEKEQPGGVRHLQVQHQLTVGHLLWILLERLLDEVTFEFTLIRRGKHQ